MLCQQSAEFALTMPDPVIAFSRKSSRELLTASPTTTNSVDRNAAAMALQLNSSTEVQSFCTNIMKRDVSCVISGADICCDAAHIVPLNAKADICLPDPIKSILLSLAKGKNDVRNGILLRKDLHYAFDRGYIALKPLATPQGLCYVVLVFEKDTCLKQYHLMPLRSRGVNLDMSPHPALLTFHLNNCLAKYICGGGLANDCDDEEEEEEEAESSKHRL